MLKSNDTIIYIYDITSKGKAKTQSISSMAMVGSVPSMYFEHSSQSFLFGILKNIDFMFYKFIYVYF